MALRFSNLMNLSLMLVTVFSLGACSNNTTAPQPGFWDPANPTVYAKLTTDQETSSSQSGYDLSKLIALTGFTNEEIFNMPFMATPGTPAGFDQVTASEIAANCERRQTTLTDQEGGTTTVNVNYIDKTDKVCPVNFSASMKTARGQVDRSRGTAQTKQIMVNFSAKIATTVYFQGTIRSLSLSHKETGYVLERNPRVPESYGLEKYTASTTGQSELREYGNISFALAHSRDVRTSFVDDTHAAVDGRDLATSTITMPYGPYAVTVDTTYDGKTQKATSKTYINGREINK